MNHFGKTPESMNTIFPDYREAKGDYLIDFVSLGLFV